MLTEQERGRLLAEEALRKDIRDELAKQREPPRPASRFERVLASDSFRWVASSMAIPLAVFLWGEYAASEARKERELAASAKEQVRDSGLAEQVSSMAKEVVEDVKPRAQAAVEQVRESAAQSVESVKQDASSTAEDVRASAQDSKETVQQHRDQQSS